MALQNLGWENSPKMDGEIRENPIRIDDLGGPPQFSEIPIYYYIELRIIEILIPVVREHMWPPVQ